jgi:uncharacterized protein (TIGR02996 family)
MASPYDHPDWLALVAAIRATPDDDLPRLVAADWLEEHGEPERAEFIRLQCELEPMRYVTIGDQTLRQHWLQDRERELFSVYCWFTPPSRKWVYREGNPLRVVDVEEQVALTVRRGYFDEACCRIRDWTGGACDGPLCVGGWVTPERRCENCRGVGVLPGIGPLVIAAHPVERVVATDREPIFTREGREGLGDWAWVRDDLPRDATERDDPAQYLAPDVWDRLNGYDTSTSARVRAKRYPTRELAEAALSADLIAWALAQPAPVPA